MWIQTFIVVALVAVSAVYLFGQLGRSLAGHRSKIGSCCAKGCEPVSSAPMTRTAFIPSEFLVRRK